MKGIGLASATAVQQQGFSLNGGPIRIPHEVVLDPTNSATRHLGIDGSGLNSLGLDIRHCPTPPIRTIRNTPHCCRPSRADREQQQDVWTESVLPLLPLKESNEDGIDEEPAVRTYLALLSHLAREGF